MKTLGQRRELIENNLFPAFSSFYLFLLYSGIRSAAGGDSSR